MNSAKPLIPRSVDSALTIAAIRAEVAMHGSMTSMAAFERMRCARQSAISHYLMCIARGDSEAVALQAALETIWQEAMLAQLQDHERSCAGIIER